MTSGATISRYRQRQAAASLHYTQQGSAARTLSSRSRSLPSLVVVSPPLSAAAPVAPADPADPALAGTDSASLQHTNQ